MKLLAIMRPRDNKDVRSQIAVHARDELHALWQLYRDGLVREMYYPAGPGAVLILESESVESAIARLAQLPLIVERVMQLELIELQPFRALEILFG